MVGSGAAVGAGRQWGGSGKVVDWSRNSGLPTRTAAAAHPPTASHTAAVAAQVPRAPDAAGQAAKLAALPPSPNPTAGVPKCCVPTCTCNGAVEIQGKGSVSATAGSANTQGRCGVLAVEAVATPGSVSQHRQAVETPGTGAVFATKVEAVSHDGGCDGEEGAE